MSKKLFFILLALVSTIHVNAQNASLQFNDAYKAAKHLLDQKKYGLSMETFKRLIAQDEQNELQPYTRFYLGNAAYQNRDIEYAKNVFLETALKYPNWNKIDAVYLWLSRIGFEQSGAFRGLLYAESITKEPYLTQSNTYIKKRLAKEPFEVLQALYLEHKSNKEVAMAYAYALNLQPSSAENKQKLDSLIVEFELDRALFNSVPMSEKKEHYTIGIMLPLFIDRVEATGKYLKKSLAIDIYEGAKLAAYDTDSTLFTLKVFDTQKDSSLVSFCLKERGVHELDAVLGPIYPKPVEKMKEVAKKGKINFLNPTSSNSSISNSSPYAFLSRASATALAVKASKYMKSDTTNRNVFIYYGTSTVDSISAFVYKSEMESDSFNVVSILKIGSQNRRDVYDILTAAETIPDREAISHMTREEIQRSIQLPTMDSLLIQPDSIGHLFIAASDPTISTEAMSAIISRGDSIKIMGVGNWFESKNAGLGIMEGLGVTLAISAVDDVSTREYQSLTNRYIEKYSSQPSKYFFRGYFGMKAIVKSLQNYGTYYQNGYHEFGNFNSLFDYQNTNYNASVKIIKLLDNNIRVLTIDGTEIE